VSTSAGVGVFIGFVIGVIDQRPLAPNSRLAGDLLLPYFDMIPPIGHGIA
jgi:hypothetical protein